LPLQKIYKNRAKYLILLTSKVKKWRNPGFGVELGRAGTGCMAALDAQRFLEQD
jgi:hypothetical protein